MQFGELPYEEDPHEELLKMLAYRLGRKRGYFNDSKGFQECDSCALKPGSPNLCRSCLIRRDAFDAGWRDGKIEREERIDRGEKIFDFQLVVEAAPRPDGT